MSFGGLCSDPSESDFGPTWANTDDVKHIVQHSQHPRGIRARCGNMLAMH